MNFELFIAKKITLGKGGFANVTAPVIRVAVAGVALGVAVMILTIAIVTGFQKEIREKATGFQGHMEIIPFDLNASFEKKPLDISSPELIGALKNNPNIRHYQVFATKAGIIKTENEIEGIVLKGIGREFEKSFFEKNLVAGKMIAPGDTAASNEILVSKHTASRLNLKPEDEILLYFVQQPPRMRKLKISGIYETVLEDMDKTYALCDIRHIRKLNDWTDSQAAGIEIFVNDYSKVEYTKNELNSQIGYNINAQTIRELNPQLFDWLGLQDLNGIILISLIILVCSINMISALLILILERTRTIGILKAVGSENKSIRKIFLLVASFLSITGIAAGNFFGILLCVIQKNFGIIKLDQASYYIPVVPINFSLMHLLLLNVSTLAVCILLLIIPTAIITKISPVKAIRFS